MLSLDMEQAKQRHGYTEGLEAPRINRNFNRIKSFMDDTNFSISGTKNKVATAGRIKRETTTFYDTVFKLHDVCILPKKFDPIFDRYLTGGTKTTEGFKSLLEKYAVYESPFHIPLRLRTMDSFATGLICYFADGLDESELPIVNTEIVTAPFTDISSSIYANQICSTQLDRIKGSVPNFHDREVLSILMEKILAYELKRDVFYEMQRLRMFELQGEMELLKNVDSSNNVVWAFVISSIKAEELFDHYIRLSDDDKKAFFGEIQRVFDGDINSQDFLDKIGIEFNHEQAIPAISRNLNIR